MDDNEKARRLIIALNEAMGIPINPLPKSPDDLVYWGGDRTVYKVLGEDSEGMVILAALGGSEEIKRLPNDGLRHVGLGYLKNLKGLTPEQAADVRTYSRGKIG